MTPRNIVGSRLCCAYIKIARDLRQKSLSWFWMLLFSVSKRKATFVSTTLCDTHRSRTVVFLYECCVFEKLYVLSRFCCNAKWTLLQKNFFRVDEKHPKNFLEGQKPPLNFSIKHYLLKNTQSTFINLLLFLLLIITNIAVFST